MKLTSILKPNKFNLEPEDIKSTIIAEDCTLAQAFTMIESWCYDNDCVYPSLCDVWKSKGIIIVRVKTNDNKFINEFNIID